MSNVGQRVALWPDFPQEKHFISAQSRCTGRCLNSWSALCLPLRKFCSLVSNLIGSVCTGKVGFLVATFSVKSCQELSNPNGSGTLVVGVAFGVSISTSFLSSSLVSSTGHSGLFTVTARTGSGSFSGVLTTYAGYGSSGLLALRPGKTKQSHQTLVDIAPNLWNH